MLSPLIVFLAGLLLLIGAGKLMEFIHYVQS